MSSRIKKSATSFDSEVVEQKEDKKEIKNPVFNPCKGCKMGKRQCKTCINKGVK